ncbi:MAG: metal-sensitive transcriptional regulator [Elusimicrobia bacterium]|nr:metal-sensitive transcriptional regulator [Elusimicrobiota bacterium]
MEHGDDDRIRRLNRIEGQVRGIRKMVEEGRYCIDIALQIRAARAALKKAGIEILDSHLRTCVTTAIQSRDKARIDAKLGEIKRLLESWEE